MKAAIWIGVTALTLGQAVLAQSPTPCPCSSGALVLKPGLVLNNKTACASRGSEQWSEYHAPGGNLIDYKGGSPETVGKWTSDSASVTYDYGSGGRFTWSLCSVAASSTYNFCQGANVITGATLKSGQTSCP